MKKIMFMFLIVSGFIFLVGFNAYAEEETTTTEETADVGELPNAGVKPGNFFYGFDKFFENVAIKLTFSNEKKAEKLSRFAEERLAELNELDQEKAEKYSDELFSEYGLSLEKAHLYVQKLVAEGKISEEKLSRIEHRVHVAEMKQERLKEKVRERISERVHEQVQNCIKNAKMSIFNQFTDIELIKSLHEEGYGYGELLKLQAISELASTSIEELLLIENAVTIENEVKHINIDTILEAKEITPDQLREKVKEYKDVSKQEMKERIEQARENAKERRNEIKERIKARKNG